VARCWGGRDGARPFRHFVSSCRRGDAWTLLTRSEKRLTMEMMNTKSIGADAILYRSPPAVFRELADGTAVLLHLESTAYFGINRIGVLIRSLLENRNTIARITRQIREQIARTPPELAEDVTTFVGDLAARDLILIEDGSG
jgi:Coenzyme PQQ synthesis protein D (PqqD)